MLGPKRISLRADGTGLKVRRVPLTSLPTCHRAREPRVRAQVPFPRDQRSQGADQRRALKPVA
jgi:hypothetical protein